MLSSPTLPMDAQRRIDGELSPGETLLWAGQPSPGRMARQGIVPMLFGIPFTAFALFWTAMAGGFAFLFNGVARSAGGSGAFAAPFLLFPLFGLIFVAVGLGLLLSPLWLSLGAKRTLYAVTSQRVIVWTGGVFGSVTVRSLSPVQLGDRARTEAGDGSGDLIFPRAATLSTYQDTDSTNGFSRTRTRVTQFGFYGVPQVKQVDDLLRQTFG